MIDSAGYTLQMGNCVLMPEGNEAAITWIDEGEEDAPPHVRIVMPGAGLFSYLYPQALRKVVVEQRQYFCEECGEEITDTMLSDHTGKFWHENCTPPSMPARLKSEAEYREPPREWAEAFPSPWEKRLAIMEDFRRRAVLFRIAEDKLQFRDCDGTLSEGERHYLTHCGDGLKRAIWMEQGLCIRCGQEGAYRDSTWCKPCVLQVAGLCADRLLADIRLRRKKATETADEDDLMTNERSLEL